MSLRLSTAALLTAATLMTGSAASAAGLTMPTIHTSSRLNLNVTPNVTPITPVVPVVTTDHRPPCSYGCGGPPPPAVYPQHPRYTTGPTNDLFDTTGNLNPGGGGGGIKPGKKPNLQ